MFTGSSSSVSEGMARYNAQSAYEDHQPQMLTERLATQRSLICRWWQILQRRDRQPDWPHCRRAISGLLHPWLLAHRALESSICSSRYYLHLLLHRRRRLYLGRCRQFLGQSLHCPIRSWSWYRKQVEHCPGLCEWDPVFGATGVLTPNSRQNAPLLLSEAPWS